MTGLLLGAICAAIPIFICAAIVVFAPCGVWQ